MGAGQPGALQPDPIGQGQREGDGPPEHAVDDDVHQLELQAQGDPATGQRHAHRQLVAGEHDHAMDMHEPVGFDGGVAGKGWQVETVVCDVRGAAGLSPGGWSELGSTDPRLRLLFS